MPAFVTAFSSTFRCILSTKFQQTNMHSLSYLKERHWGNTDGFVIFQSFLLESYPGIPAYITVTTRFFEPSASAQKKCLLQLYL